MSRHAAFRALVRFLIPSMFAALVVGCSAASSTAGPTDAASASSDQHSFVAEVWADNWFSLAVNGVAVGEDSVPISTVRSFNAETITFTAQYPLTIAMVTKDYIENETGLEYIGTDRQQMGDGGFIAQITDKDTGKVVAVTNGDWRGLVIQRAPIDESCVKSADPLTQCTWEAIPEPEGWMDPGFDDAAWVAATVHTAAEVGPKDGYDTITWDPAAALIWTSDLHKDNTILWRVQVTGG
jgi:hypothetical protein